jgi:hypothetical protein
MDDESRPSQHQTFMNTPIILPQPAESLSSDTIVKPEEVLFIFFVKYLLYYFIENF